jgi:hypothetical protein
VIKTFFPVFSFASESLRQVELVFRGRLLARLGVAGHACMHVLLVSSVPDKLG